MGRAARRRVGARRVRQPRRDRGRRGRRERQGHALLAGRQLRADAQAGRGAGQGVHGRQPGHHGQARNAAAGRGRRQRRQDPAGHGRDDRPVHVQLGLALPGAQPREEPRAAERRAMGRQPGGRFQADGVRERAAVRRARSAAPSAAASSTTARSTSELGLEVPKTWDEFMANNAEAQGRRHRAGDPDLPGHVDVAAARAGQPPQRGRRRSGLGREVHEQPGKFAAGPGRSRASSVSRRSTRRASRTRTTAPRSSTRG